MEKERRQQKISNLISTQRITTQIELARRLERAGLVTTQSSVSRDLEELGIVKRRGQYALPQSAANNGAGVHGLLSLEPSGNALIIAKCESGMASAVAVQIDRAQLSEVVGTLAGEDTIFIAVRDTKARRAAMRKLWELFV
ncbi:MAG: hypothetical protein MSG64_11575 [Pyrinomonadaceae bacterium MAG19_C2-C3]|nr:hypothetical protein [Pyrinomonadaceae bacterium MAG19_C2-C3]